MKNVQLLLDTVSDGFYFRALQENHLIYTSEG